MPVYDRSYRRWDGQLKRHALRFVPITTMGVRTALGTKGGFLFTSIFRLLLVVSLVPFLLLFFANYAVAYRPAFLAGQGGPLEFFDTLAKFRIVQYPLLVRFNTIFLMLYTVLFGSGLIARDRAAGALPLYLSRPLTLADYILGKFCTLAWFLACLTVLPCVVLWLFVAMSSSEPGAFQAALPELLPILAHGSTVVIVYTLTMLAVSAFCRRPMFAALIWFALVVLLPNFTAFFASRFEWNAAPALSPNDAFNTIGYDLYDLDGVRQRVVQLGRPEERAAVEGFFKFMNLFNTTPVEWCWISCLGWALLSLLVLVTCLKRQEVVGDSGIR